MIIGKAYAQRLQRQGKATIEDSRTTDQSRWQDRHGGKTYRIVIRHDLQRTDHYED